jgi:hypothetical protein
MQIYTKFANFTGLYFPHFTTIPTKLCNFTHIKMLFPAIVMVSFFLSRSKFHLAGIIHSQACHLSLFYLILSLLKFKIFDKKNRNAPLCHSPLFARLGGVCNPCMIPFLCKPDINVKHFSGVWHRGAGMDCEIQGSS